MKSKILTFLFACALFLCGMTDISAQSQARTFELTKQVTVEQVQQMSNDEMIELLPIDSKTEVNKLLAIKYVKRDNVYKFIRKQIINHIENQ